MPATRTARHIENVIRVNTASRVAARIVDGRTIAVVPGGSSTDPAAVITQWRAGGWNLVADGPARRSGHVLTIPVAVVSHAYDV